MKRILVFLLAAITTLSLGAVCIAGSADIMKRYAGHKVVDDSANKSGFSIKDVKMMPFSAQKKVHAIDIYFTNSQINQNEENNRTTRSRLNIFNAEDLAAEVKYSSAKSTITKTKPDGTSTVSYGTGFFLSEPAPKYILVYFKGIPASEAAGVATPPSFFIIELDPKKSRVLTEKPLLADELFK